MKKKNAWRYHHLTQVYQKTRSYAILHMSDVIVIFHFGLFLPFYPSNSLKKENIKKKEGKKPQKTTATTTTTTWRYHYFTQAYQKS